MWETDGGMTVNWRFDPSEPHITPGAFLDFYCARDGLSRDQIALPRVMVATVRDDGLPGALARAFADRPRAMPG
jgi:hypothetical protein